MLAKKNIILFLLQHPYAFIGALLIHVVMVGILWFNVSFYGQNPLYLVDLVSPTQTETSPETSSEPEENDLSKMMRATMIDQNAVQQQVLALKEKKRLEVIQKEQEEQDAINQQNEISKNRKKLQQEQQKLLESRQKEEENIKKIKEQNEKLAQAKAELLQQTQENNERLIKQKSEAKQLQDKINQTKKEEALVAEKITQLKEKGEQTKEKNQALLKSIQKQQRALELQRMQEEVRVEKARVDQQKMEQELKEKQAQTDRLDHLQEQQQKKLQETELALQKTRESERKEINQLRQLYIGNIRQEVRQEWNRPPSVEKDWQCEVLVDQTAAGYIESVSVINCSAGVSKRFQDSIARAVNKAEPLTVPDDARVFDQKIRFTFLAN